MVKFHAFQHGFRRPREDADNGRSVIVVDMWRETVYPPRSLGIFTSGWQPGWAVPSSSPGPADPWPWPDLALWCAGEAETEAEARGHNPDPTASEVRVDQVKNVNGGVGSGELELAEPRRGHKSSSSCLHELVLIGRGYKSVKGEAPRLGREPLAMPIERPMMLDGGDGQSRLLPKASRLDWRPRRNWLAPVHFLTSAIAPSSPFPVKSLATWSCRSGLSASNVAEDGIGEPEEEQPEEEAKEEEEGRA